MRLSDIISPEDIARAAAAGACTEALDWARKAPRTWGEARPDWLAWYACHAATPAQMDACIAGTDARDRGGNGWVVPGWT